VAHEQHCSRKRASRRRRRADLRGARHLPLAGPAPELRAGLVYRAIGMEPSRRQGAATGIDGKFAVERYPLSSLDEVFCAIALAKAEILEPVDRMKTETIVALRDIDVGRFEVGSAPHHFSDLRLRLRVEFGELRPAVAVLHRR